jgi:hypothetical protein
MVTQHSLKRKSGVKKVFIVLGKKFHIVVKIYIICRDSKKEWWRGKSLQKIVSDSTFT